MLKRHAIHVLRQAGHAQAEVARLVGVGLRSVRRVDAEPFEWIVARHNEVVPEDGAELKRKRVERPGELVGRDQKRRCHACVVP